MTRRIEVVGAVIMQADRVLCTQRGAGSLAGRWEFPGGKVEPGESPEDALAREIREELGCTVKVGAKVVTTEHEYDFGVVSLTTFYCAVVKEEPTISEHTACVWLPPSELQTLNWAPADVPAVHQIQADFA
ncbi:MAG: (deoxy)nucleoside triphosphate pyrophosphohydrolase [Propionicimonas sp.]